MLSYEETNIVPSPLNLENLCFYIMVSLIICKDNIMRVIVLVIFISLASFSFSFWTWWHKGGCSMLLSEIVMFWYESTLKFLWNSYFKERLLKYFHSISCAKNQCYTKFSMNLLLIYRICIELMHLYQNLY